MHIIKCTIYAYVDNTNIPTYSRRTYQIYAYHIPAEILGNLAQGACPGEELQEARAAGHLSEVRVVRSNGQDVKKTL